jgi:hypothetical protein
MEENKKLRRTTSILEGKPIYFKLLFFGFIGIMLYSGYKVARKKHVV